VLVVYPGSTVPELLVYGMQSILIDREKKTYAIDNIERATFPLNIVEWSSINNK